MDLHIASMDALLYNIDALLYNMDALLSFIDLQRATPINTIILVYIIFHLKIYNYVNINSAIQII